MLLKKLVVLSGSEVLGPNSSAVLRTLELWLCEEPMGVAGELN